MVKANGYHANHKLKLTGTEYYVGWVTVIQKYNINHGIYRSTARLNYSFYKDEMYFIKNKIKNKVIDTSGAGDGYNAAYISNFIKFNNPQKALHAASEIGAKIVMKKGAIVNVK